MHNNFADWQIGEDDALSAHYRAPRQVDHTGTTRPGKTTEPTEPDLESNDKLVRILSGTLISMVVLILVLAVTTVVVTIWGCRMRRRRRIQRDLVERTKHDIFEGVPNVISGEDSVDGGSIPTHTVINLSLTCTATESVGLEVMHNKLEEEEEEEEKVDLESFKEEI